MLLLLVQNICMGASDGGRMPAVSNARQMYRYVGSCSRAALQWELVGLVSCNVVLRHRCNLTCNLLSVTIFLNAKVERSISLNITLAVYDTVNNISMLNNSIMVNKIVLQLNGAKHNIEWNLGLHTFTCGVQGFYISAII